MDLNSKPFKSLILYDYIWKLIQKINKNNKNEKINK